MNQTVSIGGRLVEVRKSKGLSQAAFAAVGGVSVKTQVLYEKSERVPDANYLAAIAAEGFDVGYVLTGQVSGDALTVEEAAVLVGYRRLDAKGRAGVVALVNGMQPQAPSTKLRVRGDVGQYVEGDVTVPFTIDMRKTKKRD